MVYVSAVSPTPGIVPQHKRGSTASMSQVEDTMFRSVNSSGSLIKVETQSLRSAVSTPDDTSVASSPTKYNTLPGRSKPKARRRTEVVGLVYNDEALSRVWENWGEWLIIFRKLWRT